MTTQIYHNLSKIPYLILCRSTCCYVKHQRSSTEQEEGLTNKAKYHVLLLHKQVHDKRSNPESLHAYAAYTFFV